MNQQKLVYNILLFISSRNNILLLLLIPVSQCRNYIRTLKNHPSYIFESTKTTVYCCPCLARSILLLLIIPVSQLHKDTKNCIIYLNQQNLQYIEGSPRHAVMPNQRSYRFMSISLRNYIRTLKTVYKNVDISQSINRSINQSINHKPNN